MVVNFYPFIENDDILEFRKRINRRYLCLYFYGIIIRMQSEHGGKHHVPHIHVICGDKESVFSLEGEQIEGDIPQNKKKLVEAWIEIHREDLQANWKLLDEGEQFFKIEPLR